MLNKYDCGGTNTSVLYKKLCESFGFDKSESGNFGHQGALLYANDVSKEHYSVWCLTNTNWNKKKDYEKCNWYDEISNDKDNSEIIENWNKELWTKGDKKSQELCNKFYNHKDTRLTFVKFKDGNYYFLGVYEFTERDDENKVKKFRLISTKYPISENKL